MFIKPLLFLKGKRTIKRNEIEKILVVRLAYVGDVIMTLPVLKPLKELFPRAKVFFLTGSKEAEVLKNHPNIDHIVSFDAPWFYPNNTWKGMRDYFTVMRRLRQKRFDLAIDFRGDIRDILSVLFLIRAYHRVSYGVGGGSYLLTHVVPFEGIKHKIAYHLDILRSLGATINSSKPEIYLSSQEEAFRQAALRVHGIRDGDLVVGIHPGGRKKLKCWYPEGYAQVIERLIRTYGAKVVMTGSPDDVDLVESIRSRINGATISMCGKTSIRELASLIKGFDVYLTGDTAPMHIASAVETPVVAIFGPSKSNETGPYGDTYSVVEKDFPCRFTCDEDVCKHKVFNECMKAISPDDVWSAVKHVLENRVGGLRKFSSV